jgi:hypothetical protein
MSSSTMATCLLKGCDAKYINELVIRTINGVSESVIMDSICLKTISIVSTYDIKQCVKVITTHGDFHDAYVKLQATDGFHFDVSDKLKFHRHIALLYVKQILVMKYRVKLDAYKFKLTSKNGNQTCSICLENITSDVQITRCNHTFHRACMTAWGRTCPMCRANV